LRSTEEVHKITDKYHKVFVLVQVQETEWMFGILIHYGNLLLEMEHMIFFVCCNSWALPMKSRCYCLFSVVHNLILCNLDCSHLHTREEAVLSIILGGTLMLNIWGGTSKIQPVYEHISFVFVLLQSVT